MSEPRLVSPILDNFAIGGPISDHDGVRCFPAMREDSDDKYIVKIISVPASQTKLDALLLTGAYSDKSSALAYFHEQANGILDEKKILDKLAQLEGFAAYEDCQIVPMEDGNGYDVYLLGKYRKTLERKSARAPLTQLDAVNLGIDLCAALAICRNSGYMYVDLKPSNIYITGDTEYRIGDLGFVRLNSLKYETLPDKYRSGYTAPEVADSFASLSDKLDIYAAGMVLYQAYNEGALPYDGNSAPAEEFAPPCCADEEMAQIILKACHPDPAQRWNDPVEMGQAIVSYMQKNGVNDAPLVRPVAIEDVQETEEVPAEEEIEAVTDETAEPITEEVIQEDEESESLDDIVEAIAAEISDPVENPVTEAPEVTEEETPAEPVEEVQDAVSDTTEEESASEIDYDNLSFLDDDGLAIDLDSVDYSEVTDDVSDMLSQIDELTSHPVPDPVVAPEPIEIKIPEPIVEETKDEEAVEETEVKEGMTADDVVIEEDYDEILVEGFDEESAEDADEEDIPEEERPYTPKKKRTGLVLLIIFLIVAALGVGGYFFYTEYYLQPVHSLTLTGSEDNLQVALTADIDEAYLSVSCADSHGNKISAPVVGGIAVFDGLSPDTAYTITVEVDGFHELTGTITKVYSTPIQTKIAQMNIITGSEDGSVILSFAVEGPDSSQWNVIYNAQDEAERVTAFPSHMVTLTGLTVGKEYTFRLEPVDDIYISGEPEATYVVKNLICAENLRGVACKDGILTVEWDTPADETVEEWSVRCYNDTGFDETLTTAENTVTFQNVDDTVANTVEIFAKDMSVNQRITINANSVTVSDFNVDGSNAAALALTWTANREVPENGWTVRYSVNGINAANSLVVMENAAKVPVIPNSNYQFTIVDGAGNEVLGGPFTYTSGDAAEFAAYSVTKNDITARLCKTPAASGWTYNDLTDEDYVNTFTNGEKISMVLALSGTTTSSEDMISIGFVITDESGNIINFANTSETWKNMWNENYCELDIPGVPANAGIYTVTVYFNGAEAGSQKFEINA